MSVLVVVDHHDGMPRATAAELLTAARALGPVDAVWLGDGVGPEGEREAEAAAPGLGTYGARAVHVIGVPTPDDGLPPAVAAALARLATEVDATTVLLASTFENKEIAAHLAFALDAGLVVDAVAIGLEDGRVVTTQQAFAATWTLSAAVVRPRAVVTMSSNAVRAVPADVGVRPPVRLHDAAAAADPRVRVVTRTPRPSSGRPDVGEAQVVVVGGRGTEGDFAPVIELAAALGGAVGATRDATDEGWIAREAMVGQTGVSISPRLYVGVGVSGAVHHRGGMQASGTIVAVNSDPDAPIFEIADFGVVGDLFEVLPRAVAEIRRLRSQA